MPIRVVIATTQGPAEVQRITEEDPAVRSVVCLDGKAMPLAISRQYEAFVREPTGVVQRQIGHPAFRLDVSQAIDEGLSWQLGAFVAHALAAARLLAGKGEAATQALWLTGEVDRDLNVLAVEQVARKLERSRPLFAELAAAACPVTVYIPAANAGEVDESAFPGLRLRVVADAREVLADLGLDAPRKAPRTAAAASGAVVTARASPRRRLPIVLAVAALLAGVGAAYAVVAGDVARWQDLARAGKFRDLDSQLAGARSGDCIACRLAALAFEWRLAGSRPDPARLSLALAEVRAIGGGACPPAATAARDDYAIASVAASTPGEFAASPRAGLCGLEYTLTNGGAPAHLWVFAQAVPGPGVVFAAPRAMAERPEPKSGPLTFAVRAPAAPASLRYRLVALASPHPVAEAADWLMTRLAAAPAPAQHAAAWAESAALLERRGIALAYAWHEIAGP